MNPSKEFSTRLSSAKRFRDAVRPKIEEVMAFCCPGREHDFNKSHNSTTEHDTTKFISLPEELATDLAGDLVTYFTPAEAKWATYEVMDDVPEEFADQVLEIVQDREDKFWQTISASNYNDISPMWGFEAATHGTPALWVAKAHLTQPVHFEVVPPQQLYLVPGHLGYLDRFREMPVLASTLKPLFDGWDVSLSDPKLVAKMQKPGAMCLVLWGFWVDWADAGNPLWKFEITVDGIRITKETPEVLGPLAGSCPLLVGRFNPQVGKPWGRGPGVKALPDMLVLDKVDETVLSGLDQTLMNTLLYADDGFLDLSEGIQAGRAYPASRGFTRENVVDLSRNVNVDQGWFTEDRLEDKLRRAFYQDGPRQKGDTPPTASQWLDERRRVQQRLGKPSAPLWTELILPLVQRVEFLAVEAGIIPDAITHNGRSIKVKPISPLQKAQNQDQVMVARSNLELAFTVAQDQTGSFIDFPASFKKIVKASGDELTVITEGQQVAPAAA
jgi:hypothetical protein